MRPPLKELRLKKGLTQKQLARLLGITETSCQRIEYGMQRPSLVTAIRIARLVGATVDEIWGYVATEDDCKEEKE